MGALCLTLLAVLLAAPTRLADGEPTVDSAAALVDAALAQIGVTTGYDPRYRRLAYPDGDVDRATGVCSDVVIRAYRELGLDLQVAVHEDMRRAWGEYPKLWDARKPDRSIDHRRVPNLQTYFRRHGQVVATSIDPADYAPGDLVTWTLPSGVPHIGIVSRSRRDQRPLMIHNIGAGVQEEDVLFAYAISGHYRLAYAATSTSVR